MGESHGFFSLSQMSNKSAMLDNLRMNWNPQFQMFSGEIADEIGDLPKLMQREGQWYHYQLRNLLETASIELYTTINMVVTLE